MSALVDKSARSLRRVRAGIRASGTLADLRKLQLWVIRHRRGVGSHHLKKMPHDSPMRILVHVPFFPPLGMGGAEMSVKAIAGFLHGCGHQVAVIADRHPRGQYQVDGVEVQGAVSRQAVRQAYKSANIVLTQQVSSIAAFMYASRAQVPLVHLVRDIGDWRRLPASPELLVFNAEWQRDMFGYSGRSMVVHPPIFPDRYRTTPGNRVTLINMNRRKGVELFLDLVARMPNTDFLGVTGMWGQQVVPDVIPHNLRIVDSSTDVREIYSQTRILLVPSLWESYGRVAVEAAASGIPVVASPNAGLIEALGSAGIYAACSDLDAWVDAVESLSDPKVYQRASDTIRLVPKRVDAGAELSLLERELRTLVVGYAE